MSLKILRREGRSIPVACCDVCGSWIDDAGLGAAVFATPDEDEPQTVSFTHKGACHDKHEQALRAAGKTVGWWELSRYLAAVAHNSGVTVEVIQQQDERDRDIGGL